MNMLNRLPHVFLPALLLAGAAHADDAIPTRPAGPFNNEYKIVVALDTKTWTIAGEETVTFRNFGTEPVAVLPFHLYPNAWSSTGTQWIVDARKAESILRRGEEGAGYMRIDAVKQEGGTDLTGATEITETTMRVTLPTPLAPTEEVKLKIAFATKLPLTMERMGYVGQHVDAMQWFPKLCAHVGNKFVDWPFHEPSEFFADFGRYEVSVTLPSNFEIEGSGQIVLDQIDNGSGTKTAKFTADAVHDFAWTADPNFIVTRDHSARGTEIVLLSQPFLEPKSELVLKAARLALDRYADWFFPYPYERIVIDETPPGLNGGMEYPTLFTISARAPEFLDAIASRSQSPAGVTIHEFGHQYWYGMIATNEFEEAWLDEGINTYVTAKLMDELFPPPPPQKVPRGLTSLTRKQVVYPFLEGGSLLAHVAGYTESPFLRPELAHRGRGGAGRLLFGFGLPELRLQNEAVDRFHERIGSYASVADVTSLTQKSWETFPQEPRVSYTAMAYTKPALMLHTLEGIAGFDAVRELLRSWARRHAFKHPTTADFLALAGERLPAEQVEFLKACIEGHEVVDWEVAEARSMPVEKPRGFSAQKHPGDPITADFPAPKDEPSLAIRLKRLVQGTPETRSDDAIDEKPAAWLGEVVLRNHGTLVVPLELELTYADGSVESRHFDGKAPWYRVEIEPRPSPLVMATLDPHGKIALDIDLTNNARLVKPDTEACVTLAAFTQYWIQSAFAGISWLF